MKPRAIIINAEEMTIRFAKAKPGPRLKDGRIVTLPGRKSILLRARQTYARDKSWFPFRRYILVRDGDTRALVVSHAGIPNGNPGTPEIPMTQSTLNAAIGEVLALKYLRRGALDWKVLIIIVLLVLAFVLGAR